MEFTAGHVDLETVHEPALVAEEVASAFTLGELRGCSLAEVLADALPAGAEAPEEIRADVAVLADGYEDFFAALEAADFDITQLSLSVLTALDTPEMEAASERVDAYRLDACGEAG